VGIFVDKAGSDRGGTRSASTPPARSSWLPAVNVGQGFATAMAQICAITLGVDYRRVRVVYGQTDRIAYGVGAHASRASVMTAVPPMPRR